MKVDLYLRKSRADEELEKTIGQGETLSRHRNALLRLAKERGDTIVNIHEEVVSGEELFFRPAMLEILKDVEGRACEGVMVMDIQRFGRGDTEEQGLILKTFKRAGVIVITPGKVYDLSNEYDEDYMEFEAFMGRKEYRMITRRMQGGRIRSVNEGNYIATLPPFGYDVVRLNKKTRKLVPNMEQAPVVKMIFDWYVTKGYGCSKIAEELNRLGIKSYTGGKWERTMMSNMIKNQTYVGNVVWKKKRIRKSKTPGKVKDVKTRDKSEWIITENAHEPIIDKELFLKAQEIIDSKYHVPYQLTNGVINPFAGLIICGICGSKMKRRPYKHSPPFIVCDSKCGSKSSKFELVEAAILNELKKYLHEIKVRAETEKVSETPEEALILKQKLPSLTAELKTLDSQRAKAYDLLEQGVYDIAVFTERNALLSSKIEEVSAAIKNCLDQIEALENSYQSINDSIALLSSVIDLYPTLDGAKEKNALLKTVIEKIVYFKEKGKYLDDFTLKLYPKTIDISHS